jgi:hypothetical protein
MDRSTQSWVLVLKRAINVIRITEIDRTRIADCAGGPSICNPQSKALTLGYEP